jgi:hypothetical protein
MAVAGMTASKLRLRSLDLLVLSDVEGSITDRRERRYLLDEADEIASALKDFKASRHPNYLVTTTYLGYLGVPYRLRQYDGGSDFKLECKQRVGGRTLKIGFDTGEDIRRANYEASVTYKRQAFEVNGTRVTIDTDVRSLARKLNSTVVEVKGPTVPSEIASLLPSEDTRFGKRRWALS